MNHCRILNTRPAHQAHALTAAIEALGGQVVECPLITIEPVSERWEKTLPPLTDFQQVIFTSPNAVTYFFERYDNKNWPTGLSTIAIGEATARQLAAHQVSQITCPTEASSEGILSMLHAMPHQRLLLVQGLNARPLLAQTFRTANIDVTCVQTYQRCPPTLSPNFLQEIWQNDRIDIILITSEQAMRQLFISFEPHTHTWLRSKLCVVISQRLATIAASLGFSRCWVTTPNDILSGLMQAAALLPARQQG